MEDATHKGKTYRNEWKYICPLYKASQIETCLSSSCILDTDCHHTDGKYVVHSLYFDNHINRCAKDVADGISNHFKYRIRYYNDNLDFISLEYKEKKYGKIKKQTCKITKEECIALLNDNVWDVFWNTENKLLKHFCLNLIYKNYKPKIITEYNRVAFVDENMSLRVTIDKNILVSTEVDKFLTGTYWKYPLQQDSMCILEVKFINILPIYIKRMLNLQFLRYTAFSKYFKGYKIKIKGEKIWNF